ncbi:MAG TPA: efflux RND transporter permease subunit, partial [Pyrinomonadaceae bacterium]|nr:efflux RND transporter permease subunit [Pyrinomonadaceae bacterium]
FMSSFGFTSSFAIAVSLLVSFTLTPMLAARLLKRRQRHLSVAVGSEPSQTDAPALLADESRVVAGEADKQAAQPHEVMGLWLENGQADEQQRDPIAPSSAATRERKQPTQTHSSKEGRFYRPIDRTYKWLLEWAMAHRIVVVGLCVLVVFSIVPLFMFVGKNFLPVDDQSQFEISVRAPEGTTLASTSTLVERIATDVRQLPGVTDTLITIGGGQQQVVNTASIYVKLADIDQRKLSQIDLMVKARDLLGKYPQNLRTSVQQVQAISGGGFRNADVQYVIGGPDLQKLTQYSDQLLQKLKTIPDVVDADSTLIVGKPEYRVEIDRPRAADLGVKVGDIAQGLNVLIAGQKVSTFNEGTDQYNVRVRAMGAARASQENLSRLFATSSKVGWVSLDNLVKIEEGTGPSAIDRLNRQRQVTITANVKPGGSQAAVIAALNDYVKTLNIEPGYSTGLAGRSKELGRSGYYFLLAFALSFVFMYMVLAAQFESFIHPVTILLTLPLAIPFGILS